MSKPLPLVDLCALARNRARARDRFLQKLAADELDDRISMVKMAFQSVAVVTPFPDVWIPRRPDARIVAPSQTLELEPGTHDLVIHSMDLHWAEDPVGQLIQCRRALKPNGLLLAACLGGQTLHELRACLAEAETRLCGGLSPRVAPMAEIRDLGALLQRAGLALPVADSFTQTVAYADLPALLHDLRANGETNALAQRRRSASPRGLFDLAQDIYRTAFTTPEGRLCATYEIIVLTGWAPDQSQPQPLRPGSATQRLADALGAEEQKLHD